jgi:hypothetical protein
MSFKRSDGGQSPVRKTMMVLSLLMTFVYLGLAVFVYLNANSYKGMEPQFTKLFAAILLMYGLFRGWKTWDTYFND